MTISLRRWAVTVGSGFSALCCATTDPAPSASGVSLSSAGAANASRGDAGAFTGRAGSANGAGGGGVGNSTAGNAAGSGGAGGSGASAAPPMSLGVLQAEAMDRSGPYSAAVSSPFAGVGLYANEDALSASFTFPNIPGLYRLEAT